MTPRRALAAAAALTLALAVRPAHAEPPLATFEDSAKGARADERYVFCRTPKMPLGRDALELCPLAKETPGCEGFARACDEELKPRTEPKAERTLDRVGPVLAAIGKVLVWAFLFAIAAALIVPIVRALLAARRRGARPADKPAGAAKPREVEGAEAAAELARGDALEALGRADRALADGRHDESTSLYLAAMLRALDARGLVTIARHRTNGEYVRACDDAHAREDLRHVVREVDLAEFGHAAPTRDRAEAVAARARRLVATLVAGALLLAGCAAPPKKRPRVDDPAGLELFADALAREGLAVSAPPSSLTNLPLVEPGARSPVLFVDASRTALEEDSAARLVRWVESGGVLVLAGSPATWPAAFDAHPAPCPEGIARFDDGGWVGLDAETLDDDVLPAPPPPADVRIRDRSCFARAGSLALARSGSASFAARFDHGKGLVVAVGSAEPFTNVALSRPTGARAVAYTLRALGEPMSRGGAVWIARPDDGVPPPTNPLSALARAGLVQGLVHGLVFAVLLFLAAGVRHARATPERPPTRRAFVEHVLATGAFYAKRRAARHALAAQAKYADEEIRGRSPRDPAEALRAAAAASGATVEELERLLAFAAAPGDDDRKPAEDLADLAALTRIVGRLQKPAKEV